MNGVGDGNEWGWFFFSLLLRLLVPLFRFTAVFQT
jgi:hypothetical protein